MAAQVFLACLILSLSFLARAQGPAVAKVIDVVFDLDWTLFYPVKSKVDKNTVLLPEGAFHLADGAIEVILALHQNGYRVSLFSGGEKLRNEALAEFLSVEIKNVGAHEFAFYKILNREDLTRRENVPSGAKFSETWMKDLRKVNADLTQVVMVDDSAKFVVPGQEANLYWIEKTYNYQKIFSGQMKGLYDAPTLEEWLQERRKIITFGEKLLKTKLSGQSFCRKVFELN